MKCQVSNNIFPLGKMPNSKARTTTIKLNVHFCRNLKVQLKGHLPLGLHKDAPLSINLEIFDTSNATALTRTCYEYFDFCDQTKSDMTIFLEHHGHKIAENQVFVA
jgi:hypothetical protein